MAYIDDVNAISGEMGITAGEFRELPRKVRRWALAAWRGLQERERQERQGEKLRAFDAMLKAVDPEQCDKIDGVLADQIDAGVRHCEDTGAASELVNLARLMLARSVFRSLRDGEIPVAYADRAVRGVLVGYDGTRPRGDSAPDNSDSFEF